MKTLWLNLYESDRFLAQCYPSKEECDARCSFRRLGVIRVQLDENGQPVAVSLEPLSEEGA